MRRVRAAVAVIENSRGEILLQQRLPGRPYAGYWEFPGGKIEKGESPRDALRREVQEEVGVSPSQVQLWLIRTHVYAQTIVRLYVFRVRGVYNEIVGREGQRCRWARRQQTIDNLLPASCLLWKWLSLPTVYVITAAQLIGVSATRARLPALLARGYILFQLRDKQLSAEVRRSLAAHLVRLAKSHQAIVLINDDEHLAAEVGASGVHLSAQRLRRCHCRPACDWVGASCHSVAELRQAKQLGVDFVVLSPVNKTLTHVQVPPMGWHGFAHKIRYFPLPVYALGGMCAADVEVAQSCGAMGVAMMRQAWG